MSGASRRHFSETIVPSGPGLREENLHQGSGLRIGSFGGWLETDTTRIHLSTPLGGVGGAPVLTWTSLRAAGAVWRGRLPVPMTPLLFLIVLVPGSRVRFRISGYDQFGSRIMEQTPWIALDAGAADVLHWIICSKVFSHVEDVLYQSTGVDRASGSISSGISAIIDHSRLEAAIIADAGNSEVHTYGTEQNWGIGTPRRVMAYSKTSPRRQFEVIGGAVSNLTEPGVAASQVLTLTGNAIEEELVTIGGKTYNFTATLSVENDVLIGATALDSLKNLRAAINLEDGAGTIYGTGTTVHPTVFASKVVATALTVTAKIPGAAGNGITVSETMTNGSWGAATLAGGADGQKTAPLGIFGDPDNATNVGMVLGRSAAGWQGTPHKLGIQTSDAWAAWHAGGSPELGGSSQVVGEVPTTLAEMGLDRLQLFYQIRSDAGAPRSAMNDSEYVWG